VELVLSPPGSALVRKIEPVSAPGVTYEVVNGAEPVKRAAELTAEQRMETISHGCC
jgi:hypothetical protein